MFIYKSFNTVDEIKRKVTSSVPTDTTTLTQQVPHLQIPEHAVNSGGYILHSHTLQFIYCCVSMHWVQFVCLSVYSTIASRLIVLCMLFSKYVSKKNLQKFYLQRKAGLTPREILWGSWKIFMGELEILKLQKFGS